MTLNKRKIEEAFNFLVEHAWLLVNTRNLYYRSSHFKKDSLPDFNSKRFLTAANPSAEIEKVQEEIISIPHSKGFFPLESVGKLKCMRGNPTVKFEIAHWLKTIIQREINNTNRKRKLAVLREYSELYTRYKNQMISEYNAKSEAELVVILKANPDAFSIIDKPTFAMKKTVWMAKQKNKKAKTFNDSDMLGFVFETGGGYTVDIFSKPPLKKQDEEITKLMESDPMYATQVIDNEVSLETFNKAIDLFPELIFYLDLNSVNAQHLILNQAVYQITENEIEAIASKENDQDHIKLENILWVLQINLGLLSDQPPTNEGYMQTAQLLKAIYEHKYHKEIVAYKDRYPTTSNNVLIK